MATTTVEQRLSALEQEMAHLKSRLEPENIHQSNPWIDHVFGAFKDDPLFEEAVRYGREWRDPQNIEDNEAVAL